MKKKHLCFSTSTNRICGQLSSFSNSKTDWFSAAQKIKIWIPRPEKLLNNGKHKDPMSCRVHGSCGQKRIFCDNGKKPLHVAAKQHNLTNTWYSIRRLLHPRTLRSPMAAILPLCTASASPWPPGTCAPWRTCAVTWSTVPRTRTCASRCVKCFSSSFLKWHLPGGFACLQDA